MGESRFKGVGLRRRAVRTALALLAAVLVPYLVSLILVILAKLFAYQFLYLYMPGLFLVSYFGGLWPGLVSVLASTVLASYISTPHVGNVLDGLRTELLPPLIFFFSGALMALAGTHTSRYHERLREDLARSRYQKQRDTFLAEVATLRMLQPERKDFAVAVCQKLTESLGDACGLILSRQHTGVPEPAAFFSTDTAGRERLTSAFAEASLANGGPLLRRMLAAAEPMMVLRADQSIETVPEDVGAWVDWLARFQFDAALFLPLLAGEDALGILAIFVKPGHVWDDETVTVARAAADRVALALQQIRARDQQRRRERHTAFLADMMLEFATQRDLAVLLDTVAKRCAESFGEWCAISLIDPDARSARLGAIFHKDPSKITRLRSAFDTTPLPVDHPFATALFDGRRPLLLTADDPNIGDLRAQLPLANSMFGPLGVHELLAVPIYTGGEPLGILSVMSESARGWDDDEQRLASLIADRAGVAITNARLAASERRALEDAEREARRVNAAGRVISIAASSLDPGAAFDEFAEALQLLLPFDRLAVSLYGPDRNSLSVPYAKGLRLSAPRESLEGPTAGTARGWVLDNGTPFVREDTTETHEFTEDVVLASAGIRSYAVVPMSVGGKPIGTLKLGHHEPRFYSQAHVKLVQPIADQLAITISRFQLLEQAQRRIGELSETLQRALLPVDLPKTPFASLGATYRPADPEVKVGGDWYDAILLSDDHLLLSIGDVAGHGMAAAAVMGQVRHVVRAYAFEGQTPVRILTTVNRLLCSVADSLQVSLWVAAFDPFTGNLVYSGAGHPPPLALTNRGVEQLESTGPPLGVSLSAPYREAHTTLEPGSRLVAYTDGLIEATRDVLVGERRLLEAIRATQDSPADRAVDAVVEYALGGAEPDDDVALLILDVLPVDAPASATLPAAPENLGRIRRLVRTYVRRLGMPDGRAEEIVIAVGEAALNVVEHAYRGIRGNIVIRGELIGNAITVTVRDFGQWRPQVERGRGRGTSIMQRFSDGVKTFTTPGGTTVQLSWTLDRPVPAGS